MNEIQLLKQEVANLKREMQNLKASASIPFEVERAFEGRGFIEKVSIEELDPNAYDTLNLQVPVDGTGTGDMSVLDFPVRWMKITTRLANGGNFYIPVYTLSALS